MNAYIDQLILQRYRSFPSDAVTFDNPTFLVGRNGSGKSNFVDAFSFLSEAMSSPLKAVFDRRGGISAVRNRTSGQSHPPNLGLGVRLGRLDAYGGKTGYFAFQVKAKPNHGFEVVHEQCEVKEPNGDRYYYDRAQKFKTNVEGLKPSLDPSSLCLPVVGGDKRFSPLVQTLAGMRVYSIQPSSLRDMQDPDSGVSLKKDGSNAASVLQELSRTNSDTVNMVYELLDKIVPCTKRVQSIKHGNKLSLEFTQQWASKKDGKDKQNRLRFEAFNMSDGTLRALGLLMAVFQKPKPSVLVIEEPEATMHPGALGAVLDMLRVAAKQMQVIVTTHSPELLEAKWILDNHLRIVTWEDGASHVRSLSEGSKQAIQEHLTSAGELLRSNALVPAPLFKDDLATPGLFEPLP
jgi:predicted ATPase